MAHTDAMPRLYQYAMPFDSVGDVWCVVGPPCTTVDDAWNGFLQAIPEDIHQVNDLADKVLDDVMLLEDSLNKVDDIDNLYITMYTWDNVDTNSGFRLTQNYMCYCIDGALKLVITKPHHDLNVCDARIMYLVQRDVLAPVNIPLPDNYDRCYLEDDMKDWFGTQKLCFFCKDYD